MTQDFDVAVIGGGLVGTAIAYGLARLGRRVALLDEGDIAYRAARGNFGLVWVQGKGLGLARYGSWTQLSARRWPELARALRDDADTDVALEQPGGFHVCLSEPELEQRSAMLGKLIAQPGFERYDFEILDRAALASRVPGIGPGVVGATYCRLDGHCNPLRLLRALHAALEKRDGAYLPLHKVERIERKDGRFAIETGGGRTAAPRVVLAAGLGNAALAAQVGLAAPVRPQRGQIIALERVRRFLAYPMSTVRQTDEGTVLIGDSQDEAGFDVTVDTAIAATEAARAVRIFPALAHARVTRMWAALRVMTPDAFPIYEQSASQPGAFVATCHSGVTLAAAHAFELAPRIAAGELGPDLHPFSAERFHVRKAA
ncbi:MAG TPA: FAD-binding oxidoreductase [Casimicrobiaceae bacterium]|nr:FAD-binding oxidoreductase [Casimicrobiaceae bacterium]